MVTADKQTDINDLIGKSFKRNVYGLSIWTDVVVDVRHRYKHNKKTKDYGIEYYVVGKMSSHWYSVDEIIILPNESN